MIAKRPVVRTIIIVTSFVLCLSAGGTVLNLLQRKELVLKRQRELDRITKENEALSKQIEETKDDAYVERMARDKLGLVKDGETIVIVPESYIQGSVSEDTSKTPNWRQWWDVFN